MEQIDPKRVLSAKQEEPDQWVLGIDPGQQAFFFAVEGFAQHRAHQEEAQIGKQGEVVRRDKALLGKPQNHKPGMVSRRQCFRYCEKSQS